MSTDDIKWLSPEIAMVGVALLVIGLDLVVQRKGFLALVAALGLLVPLGLSIWLWIEVNNINELIALNTASTQEFFHIFGTLEVDHFALFFKFLVIGVVGLIIMASVDYVGRMQRYQGEYYGLILLSATGMMLLAATGELISIYVALELTSLPLAALAAFLMTDRSSEAGMKFLILSAISSALLLYGMALIFGFTGSTYLPDIAEQARRLAGTDGAFGDNFAFLLGIVLIVAGFGFKISSVPFQMWVPDVYEGAPTPVTAYLSVASKAAGFAILLRIFYTGFNAFDLDWGILFASLAAASMTIGNLVAISQSNIKRLLGYSTIAHAGYMLVGLAAIATTAQVQETLGPTSILFYLGAYAVTNLAAFFAIIAISNKIGSEQIEDFSGMARRAPFLAFALALALIALIGVPPTGLFMAKLYIFSAAINSDLLWLAIVGVINSVVSAYYYLRIVRVMYLQPAPSEERVPSTNVFRVALGLSTLGIVVVGIIPGPLLRLAEISVDTLPRAAGGLVGFPSP